MTDGKEEKAPRFAGIGGHHSHKAKTVEWLTPPEIIDALGGADSFDLDPCAPPVQPWPTARAKYTVRENGLILPWRGRAFLNPPYANGVIGLWLARMAEHDCGTALIFARTETEAFFEFVWRRASALLFMEGRVTFRVGEPFVHESTGRRYELGDVAPGNAGAPTVLCAYGQRDAEVLEGCGVPGAFVPLLVPRAAVCFLACSTADDGEVTWRAAVAAFFDGHDGPIALRDLYVAFAAHPKAASNPNYAAKLRQQLQHGPYRRAARGVWERAST